MHRLMLQVALVSHSITAYLAAARLSFAHLGLASPSIRL